MQKNRQRRKDVSNKGFPKFGRSKAGTFVEVLKNYHLPDFVLRLVAKECRSKLLERGKTEVKLQSMNDASLELLRKIFVECKDDKAGKYAQYRFFAYISSRDLKGKVLFNETIPGATGKEHIVPIAVKNNEMYVTIAHNKVTGNPVNKKEIARFCEIAHDIKKGELGTVLIDAIYGSSVGFRPDALLELENLSKSRRYDSEYNLDFKTANFDENIYSVTKY